MAKLLMNILITTSMNKKPKGSLFFIKENKKTIDKNKNVCYTLIIKRKENKTMTTEMEWGATIEDLLNEEGITEEELNDEESV